MTPIGFKIWYSDGSVKTSKDGAWESLPSTGIQVVTIYFAETYAIWRHDGAGTDGKVINQRQEIDNYCDQLHSQDFYWLYVNRNTGEWRFGHGAAADAAAAEAALTQRNRWDGGNKLGELVQEDTFRKVYNLAKEDRKFSGGVAVAVDLLTAKSGLEDPTEIIVDGGL